MRKDCSTAPKAGLGMVTVIVGPNRGRKGRKTSARRGMASAFEEVCIREDGWTRQLREHKATHCQVQTSVPKASVGGNTVTDAIVLNGFSEAITFFST